MRAACLLLPLLVIVGCTRGPTTSEESTALLEDATSPADHVSNEELSELFNVIDLAISAHNHQALLELARHRDFLVRIRAVKALSNPSFLTDEATEPILVERLDDAHWLVRSFAAKALGRSGKRSAIAPLRRRIHQEQNKKVRAFIETALEQLEP